MDTGADNTTKLIALIQQSFQPFFNVIAPGHSAASISNSQIHQFTN
jgi:hypothetical protein